MTTAILSVFAGACAISFALTWAMRRVAPRIGLVDRPDGFRKLHREPIPLGGGLAVFVAAVAVVVAASIFPTPLQEEIQGDAMSLWPLLLAALVIVAVGTLDDLVGLRGRQKFLGQLVAASILVAGGFSMDRLQVFGLNLELGVLGIAFTMFWLIGAINAVNLLDGMDGFATVLGIILSLATALIAAVTNHYGVAILAVIFAGGLAGFLWWNLPPASIFLGDSGSMLIGLTVGTLAIAGSIKGPGTVLLAAPLAVWTIPVLDSAAAILRRRLTGRSVYTTDRGHLHHRLLDRLGSSVKVLVLVTLLCLLTSGGGLLSLFYRNDLLATITSGAVVAIVIATGMFGRAECFLLWNSVRNVGVSIIKPRPGNGSTGRQSTVRLQGSHRWEILWETLVESAEKLRLSQIRFDVNMPALRESFHASWQRGDFDPSEEHLWSLNAPLASCGKLIGRVSIVGEMESGPLAERLDQVVEMLDGVGGLLDAVGSQPASTPHPKKPGSKRRRLVAQGRPTRPGEPENGDGT